MLINHSIVADIKAIIVQSRDKAVRATDYQCTWMYWHIGERVFEEEQDGKERAGYGNFLIKSISDVFQPQFGTGFTARQIIYTDSFTVLSQM